MTILAKSRRAAAVTLVLAAVTLSVALSVAAAGYITDRVAEAERHLDAGEAAEALEAFDAARAAFWARMPLTINTAVFVEKSEGFANYTPREDAIFQPNDTLLVHIEPYGAAHIRRGDRFTTAVAVDVEIRTPGGLIIAKAEDFGQLAWTGRDRTHELDATISLPLPELKPGDYELVITFRDLGSTKTTSVTLPFSVAG